MRMLILSFALVAATFTGLVGPSPTARVNASASPVSLAGTGGDDQDDNDTSDEDFTGRSQLPELSLAA